MGAFSPKTHSKRGQSLVELGLGLIVLIPVILLGVDLSTLYMGVSMNDNICRDAARAASSGQPSSTSAPYKGQVSNGESVNRAKAVVARANQVSGAIQIDPKNIVVTEDIVALPSAPYGGPVNGQVTVQTSVDIYPPFLLSLVNKGQAQTFKTNKTFSFTWSMESTATLTPPSSGGTTF